MIRSRLPQVQESCNDLGFEFLDEKYKNSSFEHTFKCIRHDQVFKSCLKSIRKGVGLRCCRLDRIKQWLDVRKHTPDQVQKFCSVAGFKLVDKEYLHINYRHHFRCLKHNKIHRASYKQIKRGIGLECCRRPAEKYEARLVEKLKALGFKLLCEFDGINSRVLVKCIEHGQRSFVALRSITRDHKKLPCCHSK